MEGFLNKYEYYVLKGLRRHKRIKTAFGTFYIYDSKIGFYTHLKVRCDAIMLALITK